jgi:hypothetical protein
MKGALGVTCCTTCRWLHSARSKHRRPRYGARNPVVAGGCLLKPQPTGILSFSSFSNPSSLQTYCLVCGPRLPFTEPLAQDLDGRGAWLCCPAWQLLTDQCLDKDKTRAISDFDLKIILQIPLGWCFHLIGLYAFGFKFLVLIRLSLCLLYMWSGAWRLGKRITQRQARPWRQPCQCPSLGFVLMSVL